ncbi:MAG: hypothetical protein EYC70_16845 [Planctomycetota bacterium]|nr:MAG: hypothetical protein EYC70_16845 [Planctomycetota bacterium]
MQFRLPPLLLSVPAVLALLSTPVLAQANAQGDFNGDGFDDLAVGTPFFDNGSLLNVGAANVIFGSAAGLAFNGNQRFVAFNLNLTEVAFDQLGTALAAGDFNGDGFDELAIGVPGKDGLSINNSGMVAVVPGSATGLNTIQRTILTQVSDSQESGDSYGSSLIAGDFNGDGFDDLAIGAPGEGIGSATAAGAVEVRLGSAAGLGSTGQFWHQSMAGVLDTAETNDRFGAVLEAGDFNGDGRDELVIGVATEDDDAISNMGVVHVLIGTATGLTAIGDLLLSDSCDGEEAEDQYGFALATGDFNNDGFDDLAIGALFEDVGTVMNAGQVEVRYGSSSGLKNAVQCWNQNTGGVLDSVEALDVFGCALVAADFNNDGRDDLAIGSYGEDIGSVVNAGAVNVLLGSAAGLTATGDLFLQDTACDGPETSDNLGLALGAGDYDGDGRDDLAIGIPNEDNSVTNGGAVQVVPGPLTGVTAECWSQDTVGIIGVANPGDGFGRALGR